MGKHKLLDWTNVGAEDGIRIVIKDYLIEKDTPSPSRITLAKSIHLFGPHFS